MHKKLLIGLVLTITLIFSFTLCYAENKEETGKNMVNNAENAVSGAAGNAGNMVKNATNSVKDGAQNLGNAVMNGANKAGNAVENGFNNVKDAMNNENTTNNETATNDGNNNDNGNNNGNYTATRTAGEGTFMGMSSNAWSWLILGIAAVAIIALVWYYSVQLNNNRRDDEQ